MSLYPENIPQELKNIPNWFLWKLEERDGRNTKIPYQINGKKAASTKKMTWNTFEKVLSVFDPIKYSGLGFVFTTETVFVAVDFDHVLHDCYLPIDNRMFKKLDDEVHDEILDYNSYAEISQSGEGVHIFCKGSMKVDGKKKGDREMYCNNRFFAVTGDHIAKTPKTVNDAQECIDDYYEIWFEQSDIGKMQLDNQIPKSPEILDEQVINLACSARNSAKFVRLHLGDTSNYHSPSEAEFAYCKILAFYTQNKNQIDRIYRTSRLYDNRWDRRGKYTLNKVVESLSQIYTGENNSKNIESNEIEEISQGELNEIKLDSNNRKMPNLMEMLPPDHFINIVTNWMSGPSDTYYEYQVSTALWLLSDLSQGKGSLTLKQGTIKPNLYVLLLGQSTKSKKSTAVNKIEAIREAATGIELYNDEPTIEGYLEMLARNPTQSFVCDEVSGLLAKYHQKYNAGIFDLDCKVYDGASVRKIKASGKNQDPQEYIIRAPYVTHLYATTPDKFTTVIELDDFSCGWGYRFLYAFPTYAKNRMDIELEDNENVEAWSRVLTSVKTIYNQYSKIDEFKFKITPEALKLFNQISAELEDEGEKIQNESIDSAIARAEDHILKISMLIEIGKNEPSYTVTGDSVSIASLLILDFFLPSFTQVMDRLLSDIKSNKIEKAISVIRRMGGTCTRSTLIKYGRFTARECDEITEAMVQGSIVDVKKVKETKLVTYIPKSDEKRINIQSTELTDLFSNLRDVRNLRNLHTYTRVEENVANFAKIESIPTCSALPEESVYVYANIANTANIEDSKSIHENNSSVMSVEEAVKILDAEGI